MTGGWTAIYLREMMVLRRRLSRLVGAWSLTPLLYLVAFGFAVGPDIRVDGHSYLEFLIPGLAP